MPGALTKRCLWRAVSLDRQLKHCERPQALMQMPFAASYWQRRTGNSQSKIAGLCMRIQAPARQLRQTGFSVSCWNEVPIQQAWFAFCTFEFLN
jgi:hypothetical protein